MSITSSETTFVLRAQITALEKEVIRLRAAIERIQDMSVRPVCPCGRPTGTSAIRACAIRRPRGGEK